MARASLWLIVFLVAGLSSCKFYKRDILFRSDGTPDTVLVAAQQKLARVNFQIQPFDWIDVKVYSNGGESLVDPNSEFGKQVGVSGGGAMSGAGGNAQMALTPILLGTINMGRYLVNADGDVSLPLIGRQKLANLTYRQADSLLAEKYSNFYEDAFVITRTANRRCIVLSGGGGLTLTAGFTSGRMVPLTDEGISLIEAITISGGVPAYTDMSKIKVIRGGDLKNLKVETINLQSMQAMASADTRVFPNDIIYIEPVRRPVIDFLRDVTPLISVPLSILTVLLLIYRP
jgi:polysaccharide export outer membrane protein